MRKVIINLIGNIASGELKLKKEYKLMIFTLAFNSYDYKTKQEIPHFITCFVKGAKIQERLFHLQENGKLTGARVSVVGYYEFPTEKDIWTNPQTGNITINKRIDVMMFDVLSYSKKVWDRMKAENTRGFKDFPETQEAETPFGYRDERNLRVNVKPEPEPEPENTIRENKEESVFDRFSKASRDITENNAYLHNDKKENSS